MTPYTKDEGILSGDADEPLGLANGNGNVNGIKSIDSANGSHSERPGQRIEVSQDHGQVSLQVSTILSLTYDQGVLIDFVENLLLVCLLSSRSWSQD